MKDYNSPAQLQAQAITIMEHVEDIVEHICDEERISGEKVWVMINALSDAKLAEFPSPDDNEDD